MVVRSGIHHLRYNDPAFRLLDILHLEIWWLTIMKTKLKVFRAMKNITQEELAKEIGVTRQTIIAIEKEDYNPSLELAFKIAIFFEVSIEDVFIYDNELSLQKVG